VAAEAAAEEGAFTLHETLATLSRLLESGIASSKILERSQDVLAGVARLADKLSAKDSQELAQGIEDAADEAESQYNDLSADERRSKAGRVKEATAKLLKDALSVLMSGKEGPQQDRAARVREARRDVARRPGANSRRIRDERNAAAAARAAAEPPVDAAAAARAIAAAERDRAAADAAAEAEAAARAEAERAAVERARRGRRGAAPEGQLPPGSPALERARAAREAADARAAEAEAAAAEFLLPRRMPAAHTEPYRDLVRRANEQSGLTSLRAIARAYGIVLPQHSTKAAAYDILLGV
jgi:colicin import membrane protein